MNKHWAISYHVYVNGIRRQISERLDRKYSAGAEKWRVLFCAKVGFFLGGGNKNHDPDIININRMSQTVLGSTYLLIFTTVL